jgi:hypothetical protein
MVDQVRSLSFQSLADACTHDAHPIQQADDLHDAACAPGKHMLLILHDRSVRACSLAIDPMTSNPAAKARPRRWMTMAGC